VGYIKDMQAWLASQAPGPIERDGEYVAPGREARARVKVGAELRVAESMYRSRPVKAQGNEVVVPMVMLQVDLRSVNMIDDTVLKSHLDAGEQQFIEMMNRGQGRLQLFYTDGWKYRNGVSHFLFSRIVGAVKELP